jgi:hypothetical protein
MGAWGISMPPLLVFPMKNIKWFQHFTANIKSSADDPVLLVLDDRHSHTRNVEIIEMARENGVATASVPPHSTHNVQLSGESSMSLFKTQYCQEIENWFKHHGHRIVTTYHTREPKSNA